MSRQCRGSQSLAQPDFGHYQDEWLDVLLQKKAGGVVGVLIPVMIVRIIDNYSCNDSYVIILIPVNLRTYDSYKL